MKKIIAFFTILYFNCCLAQNGGITNRQCDREADCILLARCPPLLKKAVSRNAAQRREVRGTVCKFQNRRMYVCCPKTNPIQPKLPTKKVTFGGSRKDLFPKDCGKPPTDDRIFGGTVAPIGAYPWMVALGYKINGGRTIRFECAGSIISSRYVLTAAHCVNPDDIPGLELSALNLGDWDIENPGIDCEPETRLGTRCSPAAHLMMGFEDVIIHENYNKRFKVSDDIALIRLDRELDFTKRNSALIQPVCIPPSDFDISTLPATRHPIAAGWGFTEHGNKSNVLLRVEIPFQPEQSCKDLYNNRFTSSQICAGGLKGLDSCGGDSGGPLVTSGEMGPPFLQIGIVSFGPRNCGQAGFPAVYTAVSKYRKWIVDHMKP